MATRAGDERPAGPVSHGRLRASHADREQVIETLKAAFVQGRLTKEELDARAGQAFAARTYAELGTLTADLPAAPPAALVQPRRLKRKRAKIKWVAIALAMPVVLSSPHSAQLFFLLSPFFFMALAFVVAEAVAARLENRSDRGQLPPGPAAGPGGQPAPRSPSGRQGQGPGQAAGSMMTLRPSRCAAIPNA